MLLRVRGPEGQKTLKIEPSATIDAFWALLEKATGVPVALQEVRAGFPPRPLAFPPDLSSTVASLGIQSGDSLTVTQPPAAAPVAAAALAVPAVRAAPPAAVAPTAAKNAGSSSTAADSCAYCSKRLSPFQRFHCLSRRSVVLLPGLRGAAQPQHWPAAGLEGRAQQLTRYLRDFPPWDADVPQDLAWILVSSGRRATSAAAGGAGGGAVVQASPEMLWAAKSGAARTAAAAQQIGRDCGILSGKWMIRVAPNDEEAVWGAVAHTVYVEGLCHSAKISAGPQGGGAHQQVGQRVICVYTDDFGDREEAMRVHAGLSAALRAAQPQRAKWPTITYKPDIYTHLGLYYGNADKNKPTIYSKKL